MSKALARIAGLGLAALLVLPTAARAGIIDVIYGMSGPKMLGFVLVQCEANVTKDPQANVQSGATKCYLPTNVSRRGEGFWLTLDSGIYYSLKTDTEGQHYDKGDVWMIVAEPMATGRWKLGRDETVSVRSSAGATVNWLFGKDPLGLSTNIGLKVEPVSVAVPIPGTALFVEFTPLTFRFYPRKFHLEDFGKSSVGTSGSDKGTERVYGASIALGF